MWKEKLGIEVWTVSEIWSIFKNLVGKKKDMVAALVVPMYLLTNPVKNEILPRQLDREASMQAVIPGQTQEKKPSSFIS